MSRTPTTAQSARTCTRILDGALELFNRDGTARVTTNHIAAHLGMSTGNLYYWFAAKDEIVRALFARFTAAHAALWDSPEPGRPTTPDELFTRLGAAVRLTADHRFFARDLLALTHGDPMLRAAYAATRRRRIAEFTAIAHAWLDAGIVRPLSDDHLDATVHALWVISETWWALAELDGPEPDPRDGERLLRAVLEPILAVTA